MDENKIEKIIQGFSYAQNILNTITVSGIDNCNKISAVHNNISVFLSMIANGEIEIVCKNENAKRNSIQKGGK